MRRQIDIPLVQQDLSHQETMLQISLSLEKLEKVVTSLFTNINSNIGKQNQQLADIQERCASARRKVDKLNGIDKSLQVFASSKFPGDKPPTFYPLDELEIEENDQNIRIPFTPLPPDKLSMNEKLKFYHIKDSMLQLRKNEAITPAEGLGDIPDGLRSVNSLLLFNTKQNVYSQYKILDPLAPARRHVVVEEKDTRPSIGPAPPSLAAAVQSQPSLQNYFYSPSLQDVPDIDAPLNLPNLSGIAGDLRFGEGDDQIDYPKIRKSSGEPGFETVIEPTIISTPVPREVTVLPQSQVVAKVPEPPTFCPPPPPPPPPLPPPDVQTPTAAPRKEVAKLTTAPKTLPAVDTRADLMAAIRNAGGSGKAKLKSVIEDSSTLPNSESSGKTGNFLEDLHAKLSMRRKGISGKLDNPENVGMLDRVNSMIPPPPPKDSNSQADDGSDWEE